jgi:hypothetical protein
METGWKRLEKAGKGWEKGVQRGSRGPEGGGVPSGGLVNLRFPLQNFREKSLIPHIQRLE